MGYIQPPGDRRREVLNSPRWPASEEGLVDALLGFANGGEVVMLDKPRDRPETREEKLALPRTPIQLHVRFGELVRNALERPAQAREDFMPVAMSLAATLGSKVVVSFGPRGYAVGHVTLWSDLEGLLGYAMMLLLDAGKPYGAALSRCQCCGRFYLARKNRRGGPANRIYCSPAHRLEHHNSAERKAATEKRRARHK